MYLIYFRHCAEAGGYAVNKPQILMGLPVRDVSIILDHILKTYCYKVMREREKYINLRFKTFYFYF